MNAAKPASRQWDIFCQVIDNFGDLGVCWRLASQLAQRGQRVRLWVDDPRALEWLAPGTASGIEVRSWTQPLELTGVTATEVLVEAFGCSVEPDFLNLYASDAHSRGTQGAWINLEYLSAENYVERSHGLPSPALTGPGAGLSKHFYYPGFTPRSGGLLREPGLLQCQSRFDRTAWLNQHIPQWQPSEQLISLFCYEPPALMAWLTQLAQQSSPTRLTVTSGRATEAVMTASKALQALQPDWNAQGQLRISWLPLFSQVEFDHLLWACDLNFVRGEDSLVRSLWAGKPAIWQIYPQVDGAHEDKLEAFLSLIQAPDSLRQFHRVWNGLDESSPGTMDLNAWGDTWLQARERLLLQPDLTTQLLEFVASHSRR